MSMTLTVRDPRRVDWSAIKGLIRIEAVAVSLLGPSEGRNGSRGLWWPCPFHEDRNPSFQVSPERGSWKCWAGCGHGDAPALLMRREGLTFPEAVKRLASMFGLEGEGFQAPPPSGPRPASRKPKAEPTGLPPAEALEAVALAENRLWSPEGREALAYLRGRGLTDETIRAARLGFVQGLWVRSKSGKSFPVAGITIPWFDGDRLARLKIRRTDGREPKYIEAFRDRPALYPPPSVVRPGEPLIAVEGEFDALLLAQELGDRAAVVTLGSASGRRSAAVDLAMASAFPLYVATDADNAGDDAANIWPSRAIRVRPEGAKDWTDVRAGGFGRIAYVWGRFLPLGSPPKSENFADLASLAIGHDPAEAEREALEEREAIQAEPRLSDVELARNLRAIGHHDKAEALEAGGSV